MVPYITFQDLCSDIRSNIHKIPKDVMGVAGVMRSGMIPASVISQYLNVGLMSFDDFCKNVNEGKSIFECHGGRPLRKTNSRKILVVDDTCAAGTNTLKCRKTIEDEKFGNFEFVFLSVYMEGNGRISKPDIYLRNINDSQKQSATGCVLYEWNIFHHYIQNKMIYDFDGMFCVDPPDDHNVEEYEKYLKNATPLFIPTSVFKLNILTYRREKYRKETEDFLKANGVENFNLYMFDENVYGNRENTQPWFYKGSIYKINEKSKLFIESDDFEAQCICHISQKSVYCVSTNKMYNFN